MNRRDTSLTFALCLSLALHALLYFGVVQAYLRDNAGGIYLAGLNSKAMEQERAWQDKSNDVPVYYIPDRGNEMGESDGKGKAANSSPGDETMRAMEGSQEQSWLSRDAQGAGSPDNLPSPSIAPPGQGGERGEGGHRANGAAEEMAMAAPFGAHAPTRDDVAPPPRRSAPAAEIVAPARPSAPAQSATPPSSNPGAPGRPGAPVPAADPAPQSDSESDPFATIGSVDFRAGRVDARFGRKVKTVRPRLTEGGKWDLASLQSPLMIFKVKIDDTGKVTSVDLLRSSGSNNVDLPCQRALYEWWIEPPKDKDGKPIPDVMTWTISYR